MSSSTAHIYEKVYLFITHRINEAQSDRFFGAEAKEWNFYVHDIEAYFNQKKVYLFIAFYISLQSKEMNLKQIIDEAFEVKSINAKLALSRLLSVEKEGTLDLNEKAETISSLLNGINYLKTKDCFRTFVDGVYAEYTRNDTTFKDWKKIFYLEDSEANLIACAINDYPGEIYQNEFIKYIFERLPELFSANNYYVFRHGRYLIKDSGDFYVCEYPGKIGRGQILCPEKFYIKSFHHTFFYLEYEFLISQGYFDYLKLELPFDPEFRESLDMINNEFVAILDAPECALKVHLDKLKNVLKSIKENKKCREIEDIATSCIEQLQKAKGGEDVVNVINCMLDEYKLLKIR